MLFLPFEGRCAQLNSTRDFGATLRQIALFKLIFGNLKVNRSQFIPE